MLLRVFFKKIIGFLLSVLPFIICSSTVMKNKTIKFTLLAALTTCAHAQSFLIDFNTDSAGNSIVAGDGSLGSGYDFADLQPYANLYGNNQGVTFTALSDNEITVYNTDFGGADLSIVGQDDDLEPLYEGGNNFVELGANHNFGNAFILQTNNQGAAADNIDLPNDEGDGGSYVIESDLALGAISFDILDIDSPNVNIFLTFTDSDSGEEAVVFLSDFEEGSGSVFAADDVEFGDRHSNNVSVTLAELQTLNSDITQFDQITFEANSSGALAQVEVTLIPEPSSTLLAGLGMLTLAFRRKR